MRGSNNERMFNFPNEFQITNHNVDFQNCTSELLPFFHSFSTAF